MNSSLNRNTTNVLLLLLKQPTKQNLIAKSQLRTVCVDYNGLTETVVKRL